MTQLLYRKDAYLKSCKARVVWVGTGKIVLDQTVFFAASGGQPGDQGYLRVADREYPVTDTVLDRETGNVIHLVTSEPPMNSEVIATLDWTRRHLVMRTHTALHLLYAAIRLPVTGGSMDASRGRLDFDMPEPPDRSQIETRLNALVAADLAVTTQWVNWKYLDSNPELVKTMAVRPPRTQDNVSLVEIDGVDIQACGGTHVRSSNEVGPIRITKISKKGKLNRRVSIELANA